MEETARIYRAIGEAVAAARNAHHPRLTQQELAARTNGAISRSALANIERGRQRVSVHHLYAIAAALDIRPHDLLPPMKAVPNIPIDLAEVADDPDAIAWLTRVVQQRGPDDLVELNRRIDGAKEDDE